MPEITKGMKSIGSKALLKINNKYTILEHQISIIKKLNNKNKIFLATGFQHNKIQKIIQKYRNVFAIFEQQYAECNEAKHVLNFIKYLGSYEDVFIINNGIIFKNDCFKNIKKNTSKIFLLDKYKDHFDIGCSDPEDIKYLFYDLPNRWSECIFLKKHTLENIAKISIKQNIDHYFLFEMINMIHDDDDIKPLIVSHKNIMKINTLYDLTKAKRFI